MFPFAVSELKALDFSMLLGIPFLSSDLVNKVIDYLNNVDIETIKVKIFQSVRINYLSLVSCTMEHYIS